MGEEFAKKTCPRCGERLYADMRVCYGCLYDFTRSDNGPSEIARQLDEPEGLGGVRVDALPGEAAAGPAAAEDDRAERGDEAGDRGQGGRDAGDGRGDVPGAGPGTVPARTGARVSPAARAAAAGPAALARAGASEDIEITTMLAGTPASSLGRVRVTGGDLEVDVPMEAGGIAVGRGSGNQVVIHDKAVSRRHLRLMPAPGGVEASDLGATNPACFRGEPVDGAVLVAWGESVQVGEVVITPHE